MFWARSCKFCEQPEVRIPSHGRAVRAVRAVRVVLVNFSGRPPCRWHRWDEEEGWLSPCGFFFWAFHSLRKYQNTHFFKTRSKLRTESLMFLLPEAGDCVMG